jgi:hypothetical protein
MERRGQKETREAFGEAAEDRMKPAKPSVKRLKAG